MDGPIDALVKDLLRVTREGPVAGWTHRLAEIAAQTGLELAYVNWHESPYNVAQQIVRNCSDRMRRQQLEDLVHPGFLNHRPQPRELPPRIIEQGPRIFKVLFYRELLVHKDQYLEFVMDSKGKITSVTTGRLPKELVAS